jgi:superfamily II DNA or RNA helicase
MMPWPTTADALIPVEGCWARDAQGREGRVGKRREEAGRALVHFQWAPGREGWRPAGELRSAFRPGFVVEHVAPGGGASALGVGTVQAARTLAGCDQVLVQLFESGASRWLPFQALKRVKPVEERLAKGVVGAFPDHAERFRLRVLAHALKTWDQATGALARLDIDPLPHQTDLAHKVVSSNNVNWLIADDVGLGKTIEVGLILHMLGQKGQCRRVLVVCPAGLVRQWQDEMRFKFNQQFEIYGRDFVVHDAPYWRLHEKVIVSLDLAKREANRDLLRAAGTWDLVIFDEAHRLSRSEAGARTERYRLAEALRPLTPSLLLLTATPHQGKTDRFAALLELARPDLRDELRTLEADPEIVGRVVLRNPKSRVTDAAGNLIFRGHDTHRVHVQPSPAALAFDRELQRYLRHGYAVSERTGARGRAIGFVMTTYRKLASSSVAAIARALELRLERLRRQQPAAAAGAAVSIEGRLEAGELDPDELADQGELFGLAAFFDEEAAQVEQPLDLAGAARARDEKLRLFLDEVVLPLRGRGQNLLVFTEYRATQRYLADRLAAALPGDGAAALIHGSMGLDEKLENVRRFNAGEVPVLVSTEAGGEGLNLHRACHVMVNYDLPWNPSRLVQRIGRLYRYGQARRVVVFNLMNRDGFDNNAIALLMERVETIARDLAAVAGDRREALEAEILGGLLDHVDLEAILERAVEMRIERTQAEIDLAVEAARRARSLQEELLSYAQGYTGDAAPAGVDARHVRSFVLGMLPFAGIRAGAATHGGRAQEIELPEDQVGLYPEFGRRRFVTLAFDRQLARERDGMFPVDLESGFFGTLIALAKERGFDGLCASAAAGDGASPGWLGVHHLRWQDEAGKPLEDELVPVRCGPDGAARRLEPAAFGELLLAPLASAPPCPPPAVAEVPRRLAEAAEAEAARSVGRRRQPGSLFLLAAAALAPAPAVGR